MKATIQLTILLLGASLCIMSPLRPDRESETSATPAAPAKTVRARDSQPQGANADATAPRTAGTGPEAPWHCPGCADCKPSGAFTLVSTPPKDPASTSGPSGTGNVKWELGDLTPGREALVLEVKRLRALRKLQRGDRATVPVAGAKPLEGSVTMAADNPKNGWWIRSVALDANPDAVLVVDCQPNGRLGGKIFSRSSESAFLLTSVDEGRAVFKEIPRTDILPDCSMLNALADDPGSPDPLATTTTVPLHESLPGATKVIYIDFNGELVANTTWNALKNGGNPIDALPSGFDSAKITEIWEGVSEDFRPFQVNITTNRAVYDTADAADRMMALFTPTVEWYASASSGVRGVAYLRSFGDESDRVCWIFTAQMRGIHNNTLTASHELGHTLSLSHDGDTTSGSAYHRGLGSGDMSWGPLMGGPFGKAIVQWNAGDYLGADNTEDDVAIITNWLGRRSDDFADSHLSALPIGMTGTETVDQTGLISDRNDLDLFRLSLNAGQINLQVRPFHPSGTNTDGVNLDVQARLLDANGNVLATNRPYGTVGASINRSVTAGTYFLEIDGAWESGSDGYSTYGSLGSYTISGTIPAAGGNSSPALAVTGNGRAILSGDSTPDPADDTNFGPVLIGNGAMHTFTLHNTGGSNLTITQVTTSNGRFAAATAGLPWTIGPYSTRSLPVTFTPTTQDPEEAMLSITHTGQGASPHTFTLGGAGAASGSNDDSYEENDSITNAYDLSSSERTWLSDLNGPGNQGDEDWFEINVSPGFQLVQIDCRFTDADGDIDIALYDAAGNRLAGSDSVSDDEFIEFVTPTSGTHYIKVYYADAGNSYDLWWDDLQDPGTTPDDHGDDRNSATPLTAMNTVSGALAHGGDNDYFAFTITEPSIVIASTEGAIDTYGLLLSETETLAANDDGGTAWNFRLVHQILKPGRYYIQVRGFSSATLGAYDLTLKTAALSHFGVEAMTRNPNGSVALSIMTEPGRSYAIQRSPNLVTWQWVATGVTGSRLATWTDGAATGASRFYYRTVLE